MLIFKWCADEVPVSQILALTHERPLFGHKSGKQQKTHWIAFLKANNQNKKPSSADAWKKAAKKWRREALDCREKLEAYMERGHD